MHEPARWAGWDHSQASGRATSIKRAHRHGDDTADSVMGGFRYAEKTGGIGSLLLGLYHDQGKPDHIGFTSSFNPKQRRELKEVVELLVGKSGFMGRAPGGPSRWRTAGSSESQPFKPKLRSAVPSLHPRALSPPNQISALAAGERSKSMYKRAKSLGLDKIS
jgi:ATP-dependent DNA ligase